MLSIIIATDGEEQSAVATLSALVPGAAAGLIREVVLADRAASATIARVADVSGCTYLASPGSRAEAFSAGAAKARSPWLMFLGTGAVLDPTWIDETAQFIQTVAMGDKPRAGIFQYARSPYAEPSLRERICAIARLAGFPSVDQGLLIARDYYEKLGGYRIGPGNPERRMLKRLGRSLVPLRSRIVVT